MGRSQYPGNEVQARLDHQAVHRCLETKFFLKVVDAQVEFFTDAGGAVTHAVMSQNGRERKVSRTSATVVEPK